MVVAAMGKLRRSGRNAAAFGRLRKTGKMARYGLRSKPYSPNSHEGLAP
jgi:hypothetical protein